MSTELDSARAGLDRAILPTAASIRRRGDRRQRRQAITGGLAVIAAVAGIAVGLNSRAGGIPTPPGSASPSPSVSSAKPPSLPDVYPDPLVMDVNGVGPYRIGTFIDTLQAADLIDSPDSRPQCPGMIYAIAKGYYAGTLLLTFQDDQLVAVGTAGGLEIRSLTGATVGMSFAHVKSLYGGKGTSSTGADNLPEFTVTSGDRVLDFSGNPIRPGVGYYEVGLKSYVQPQHIPVDTGRC
jgi:hypothetical protein